MVALRVGDSTTVPSGGDEPNGDEMSGSWAARRSPPAAEMGSEAASSPMAVGGSVASSQAMVGLDVGLDVVSMTMSKPQDAHPIVHLGGSKNSRVFR